MEINTQSYRTAVMFVLFAIAGSVSRIEFAITDDLTAIVFAIGAYGCAIVIAGNWMVETIRGDRRGPEPTEL